MWLQFAIVAIVACVVTMAFVPLARKIAFRIDAVDYPSARRVNKKPVARFGGVAMFLGLVAAIATIYIGAEFFGWIFPSKTILGENLSYPGIALGMVIIFLVGVIDDIWDLKPAAKFLGQIVAAAVIAASGLLLDDMHNPFGSGMILFGWMSYPITVFYLVAFANIINLIDGLDGLASGITAIAATTIFIFATLTMRIDAALFCMALVGICIGFLRYNFYPASIFMGDSGALLLGMGLGVVSLFATARSALFVSLLVPIIVAGVPIIDTAAAIVRRLRAHQPIQKADRGHIHHQLLKEGFSQRKTVLIMWGWTAVLAACAILITEMRGIARIPFALLALGVSAFFIIRLKLLGSVLKHHYNPRPASYRITKDQNGAESENGQSEKDIPEKDE